MEHKKGSEIICTVWQRQLNFCSVRKVTWQHDVSSASYPVNRMPLHTPHPYTAFLFFRLVLTQASRQQEHSIITLINNWGKANDLPDILHKKQKTSLWTITWRRQYISKWARHLGEIMCTRIFSSAEYTVVLLFGRRRGMCLLDCCRSVVMVYLEPTKFPNYPYIF